MAVVEGIINDEPREQCPKDLAERVMFLSLRLHNDHDRNVIGALTREYNRGHIHLPLFEEEFYDGVEAHYNEMRKRYTY